VCGEPPRQPPGTGGAGCETTMRQPTGKAHQPDFCGDFLS